MFHIIYLFCIQDTNEASVFLKCLLTLSKNDIQQLLIHYFVKVVDIKESERENDELIAKLDVNIFINCLCKIYYYCIILLININIF